LRVERGEKHLLPKKEFEGVVKRGGPGAQGARTVLEKVLEGKTTEHL